MLSVNVRALNGIRGIDRDNAAGLISSSAAILCDRRSLHPYAGSLIRVTLCTALFLLES